MFRKFYRSKRLRLTCPHCGENQDEPTLVISSFCRSCGERPHARKVVPIPSSGLKVSGVVIDRAARESPGPTPEEEAASTTELGHNSKSRLITSDEKKKGAQPLPKREIEERECSGISAGAFFDLVDEDYESATTTVVKKDKRALAEGSMEAEMDSQRDSINQSKRKTPPHFIPLEQRKKRKDQLVADYKVRCFRCYQIQFVSRFAKSTQCGRCSAYVALANYEIKAITARVDCSGNAVFRHSGTIKDQLFSRKLIIERKSKVTFPDGVKTGSADIRGNLIGDITASGRVRVGKSGKVDGFASAHEIEIKSGETVSGKSPLDPEIATYLTLKKGFNPSVIG